MKKLLTLLLLFPFLIACSSDEDQKVITWTAYDDISAFVYGVNCSTSIQFRSNNKCVQFDKRYYPNDSLVVLYDQGTYQLSEDSLFWTINGILVKGKIKNNQLLTSIPTLSGALRYYELDTNFSTNK